jgi:hypothetical protein
MAKAANMMNVKTIFHMIFPFVITLEAASFNEVRLKSPAQLTEKGFRMHVRVKTRTSLN